MAEVEDGYASQLETSRITLKQIRNTEASVYPTRENKTKIMGQIAHLKHKDPNSPRIMTLEQELVRAEAENLVAEAQLTNVTRQKLKEAYQLHVNALSERSEKQEILAKHCRRLLELIDDTPVVPGAEKRVWEHERDAKDVLLDAEEEMGKWTASQEAYIPSSRLGSNLLPIVGEGSLAEEGREQSVTGEADEQGGKVEENGPQAQSDAYPYDPKTIETAT